MDDNSSVKVRDPATTIRLLMKYCPIEACVQARTKLASCGTAGRPHGLKKISRSVLNEVITIHTNGNTTSTVHTRRNVCEIPVKAILPTDIRSRARGMR